MNLKYKRLDSGYHHVTDVSAHHRLAQWPIGVTLSPQYVSGTGLLTAAEERDFIRAAAQLAGTDDYWDGYSEPSLP